MTKKKLPITQQTIANKTGRPIKSPIRIGNIKEWNINFSLFLKTFSPLFDELAEGSLVAADFILAKRGAKFFIKIDQITPPEMLPNHFIENHIFATMLVHFYKMVQNIYSEEKTSITVYFFRKKITKDLQNKISLNKIETINNLTAELVVNRYNVKEGKLQILEKRKEDFKEIIYQHTLGAGEFIFLLNDPKKQQNKNIFSYKMTDFSTGDFPKKEGWVDIIGFKNNG